jgi:DNA-binding GntR family transcriptional regulator/AraC-like DNA-binding protein
MMLVKDGDRKVVVDVPGRGHLPGSGEGRLARELFSGRFRPTQTLQLREIAAEYELDEETVWKAFADFQAIGIVTLSEDLSVIVRSPNLAEMQEAYQIRAEVEEIAGRTAATVLKGYTAELRNQLAAMRAAVAEGDLDACAEHDVEFHRDIIKAAQNDVLLRTWDALAVDLRIRAAVGNISKDLHEIVESHEPIVNVLEKGHGNEAGLLLRSHVEMSLKHLIRGEWDSRSQRGPRQDLDLVDVDTVPHHSARTYQGGLAPARLRRVSELVRTKLEDELTLDEMAESAGLSPAHFSQMFRQSTGQSPHQFVVRERIERAKEMLRSAEARVLDVAVACGFKTQQHFARVFRRMCGASPTEYRRQFLW